MKDALRLSRKQAHAVGVVKGAVSGTEGAAELAYRHGTNSGRDIILVRSALLATPLPARLEESLHQGATAKFPIRADDIKDGYQGPALGKKLRSLELRWITSGFSLSSEELLK